MYITVKSLKKTLGKWIELTDLYIGLPRALTVLYNIYFIYPISYIRIS